MKVVVAVDSFKGSMTSMEAGMAVKAGILAAKKDAEVIVKPLADGGEGTTDALIEGLKGERVDVTVTGPYHEPVQAYYGYLRESNTAVMEMATAAGITLSVSSLVYDMIRSGEINASQLTVTFIDEEGLYPSMVDAAYRWRRNFLSVGAKFLWFCLPFKQVSVINHLSSSESWITWEPGKEDVWMRKPPDFAIMYSPYLHYAGEMNYQTFCTKAFSDGIQLVGLRTAESLTRYKCIANTKMKRISKGGKFYPIYDWSDSDVWLYIKQRNLEFPEIYMRLYEAGVRKNALRLCAFFGDCGTQGLRWIAETDNDLWERIQRREPNAYLVLLYWDSEMFRRTTRKRGELEEDAEKKDYKTLCKDLLFLHPERYTIAKDTLSHVEHWRRLFIKTYGIAEEKHYKTMYEGLLYGDPKMRILRILWTTIYNDHNARIKEEQNHGKH